MWINKFLTKSLGGLSIDPEIEVLPAPTSCSVAQAVPGSGYGFSRLQPRQHGCWRARAGQLTRPRKTERAWGLQHQNRGKTGSSTQKEGRARALAAFVNQLETKLYARTSGEGTPGALTSAAANVAFSSCARRHGESKANKC